MISPEHPQQADSGAHSVEAYEDKLDGQKEIPSVGIAAFCDRKSSQIKMHHNPIL